MLTAKAIEHASPREKIYRLFDGLGLYLEVAPNGSKYWRFKYQFLRKEKRIALGVYPQVTLLEAREKRDQLRKNLSTKMQLHDLIEQVTDFDSATPKDRIKVFAWWLHVHGNKELFSPGDIRGCFNKLHVDEPPALATYLARLADTKDLLKEKGQYKLARNIRAELDKKYGVHHSVVAVNKILSAVA